MRRLINSLTSTWNKYVLRKAHDFIIEDSDEITIPFHVKETGKLYPILHTIAGNMAIGEIRKFNFPTEAPNNLRVGQSLKCADCGPKALYECIWVHLGSDYFKLVAKA